MYAATACIRKVRLDWKCKILIIHTFSDVMRRDKLSVDWYQRKLHNNAELCTFTQVRDWERDSSVEMLMWRHDPQDKIYNIHMTLTSCNWDWKGHSEDWEAHIVNRWGSRWEGGYWNGTEKCTFRAEKGQIWMITTRANWLLLNLGAY